MGTILVRKILGQKSINLKSLTFPQITMCFSLVVVSVIKKG
jgi:hypothetical protein